MVKKFQHLKNEFFNVMIYITLYVIVSALLLWIGSYLREISFGYSQFVSLFAMVISCLLWMSSGFAFRKKSSFRNEIILLLIITLISSVINISSKEITNSFLIRLWIFPFLWISLFFKNQYIMFTTNLLIMLLSILGYYIAGLVKNKNN